MSNLQVSDPIQATTEQREVVQRVYIALNETASPSHQIAFLEAPNGERLPLPVSLFRVLLQAAAVLARGEEVLVSPIDRQMTTQQAADLLNVSRPYLIRLLDEGKIAFQRVGRHRRVKFGDVNRYKVAGMIERRRQLERLVAESEELGLYDLPPVAGPAEK
jgi:excisionase family DNA binding protein